MKTKAELNAMSMDKLIEYIIAMKETVVMNEISAMSDTSVLQRMNTHFLQTMKRPNLSKTRVKGKKPAKYLKWFTSEERYIFNKNIF